MCNPARRKSTRRQKNTLFLRNKKKCCIFLIDGENHPGHWLIITQVSATLQRGTMSKYMLVPETPPHLWSFFWEEGMGGGEGGGYCRKIVPPLMDRR